MNPTAALTVRITARLTEWHKLRATKNSNSGSEGNDKFSMACK
jgi:hypothetical protein